MALSCNSGYFLSAGICNACSSTSMAESCYTNSGTNHVGCATGHYLNSAGTCTACGSNTF